MADAVEAGRAQWMDRGSQGAEIPLAAGILVILFVILVPLPPVLIDGLLIFNITGSLMILMTTACVARPLDFNVFPSLLLVLTFFRLALNIATTRLILGNAHTEDLHAAGGVVRAFAEFVSGSNVVVGLIIFAILVTVQFVVITRGTSRISEVAARFTLEAMPGKQMAVDGEYSSGLISEAEARRRRQELGQEADFFGSMDGASKFVRGEAVASIVITLTNIIGGLALGILYHDMSVPDAANVFSRLTVGDGIASQVPALMVSVGTALLVTKNSGSDGLGRDLGRQLFRNEKVFFIAAVFLLVLLPSGLPVLGLLVGAAVCAGLGYFLAQRSGPQPETVETPGEVEDVDESPSGEGVRSLLHPEPIELEIGYRLVGLVEEAAGGDLMSRLCGVRERIALDLGLVVPGVKVRDNMRLQPGEYSVKLRGNTIGQWRLYPGRILVLTEGESPASVEGFPGVDPALGSEGLWVNESDAAAAAREGYLIRRVPEIVTDHLDRLIRLHAAEILTREEVSRLISDLRHRSPALVEELIPEVLRIGDLHRVLQNLLGEQVSIRNLELILEALADCGESTRDPARLTEYARRALTRPICGPLVSRSGMLHAALLDPALEEFLQSSVEETERGSRLAVEPEVVEGLVNSIDSALSNLLSARLPPVLVCSGLIRVHLRNLIARKWPLAAVLAYEEVSSDDFRLEVHGSVALEKNPC